MRPCARPGFDRRPELRPVGGGDAEPDRRAGGAEGLARGEDHRDHGVLALLTELIFEGLRHVALHTSECTPLLPVLPRFGWCRPGSGGGAFVGRVSKVRIIAVTGAEEAGLIPEARAAGADGFATKLPLAEQLIAAILAKGPET